MKILNLEPTPNPNAYKFNVSESLSALARSYQDPPSAQKDPLARQFFALPGVDSVFYLGQFVTINKKADAPWEEVMKKVGQILLDFDINDLRFADLDTPSQAASAQESPLAQQIREIIDEMIRPALAGDGGGLELLSVTDNRVYIRYQGACGSCPSSTSGTLMAIERLLQNQVHPDLTVIPA